MAKFQVQAKQCATCIYKKTSPLDIKELEAQVADKYGGFKTFRACHHADGNKVCCRGFWDRHKDEFQLGQIAQRLDFVEFVSIDDLKKKGEKQRRQSNGSVND